MLSLKEAIKFANFCRLGFGARAKVISDHADHVDRAINTRARLLAKIEESTLPDGTMWVREWSRDCDHCEATRMYTIPATLIAYNRKLCSLMDDAEGPVSLWPMTSEEAAEFTPTYRDHILEAFEDGHPHWVRG